MKTLSDTATPKLCLGIDMPKRSWYIFTATDLTTGKVFSRKANPEALRKCVAKNYFYYQVLIRLKINLPLGKGGFLRNALMSVWFCAIKRFSSRREAFRRRLNAKLLLPVFNFNT